MTRTTRTDQAQRDHAHAGGRGAEGETIRKRALASVAHVVIQNREVTHPDLILLVLAAEKEPLSRYPDEHVRPVNPAVGVLREVADLNAPRSPG